MAPSNEPSGSALSILPFAALTAASAGFGGRFTQGGRGLWYRSLRKPPFQPPPAVFGPVWTALYGMMARSAHRIWQRPRSPARTAALVLWKAQLAANATWSWLFFGRRRPKAALVDIGVLIGLVGAYTAVARKVDRKAAWMMAPYLAWLSFATLLNAEIVRRNRAVLPFLAR